MKEKIFDIILSRTLFGCKFWIVWDVCFFIFNILCLAIGGGFVFGFFAILMLMMLFWNAKELKEFKKKEIIKRGDARDLERPFMKIIKKWGLQ